MKSSTKVLYDKFISNIQDKSKTFLLNEFDKPKPFKQVKEELAQLENLFKQHLDNYEFYYKS